MFLTVSDNSLNAKGAPWINRVVSGLVKEPPCEVCGASTRRPVGDLAVTLEAKGTMWPDALGCGAYPLLILSNRALDALKEASVETGTCNSVILTGTLPAALTSIPAPEYYWINGENLRGASLDFEASGFVGVAFCAGCGRRTEDVGKTYDRRHSRRFPYKFREGSWNGLSLFTTDLSPAFFFCTEVVLECAKKNRLTNFRFLPADEGSRPDSPGLDYLVD